MDKATKKQLWTLFILTGEDWRDRNISKKEASRIIGELLKEKKEEEMKVVKAIREGIKEGKKRYKQTKEPAMVIYDADLEGRPVKGGNVYYEPEFSGCGTAWVEWSPGNRKFNNLMKRIAKKYKNLGLTVIKDYYGNWVMFVEGYGYSNGHIKRTIAFYDAIADKLSELGYNVRVNYRLD